jgi:hypothetical protein
MREVSGRRPRVCATSAFSFRVCGNPFDRLVLDQRAGDLVTRRLPCQSREAGCRGALPYELLDVRRAIAVVPVPRVVGAIPFVGALWICRPGPWTDPECIPGALEVVGGERYATLACTAPTTCLGLSSSAPATFRSRSLMITCPLRPSYSTVWRSSSVKSS